MDNATFKVTYQNGALSVIHDEELGLDKETQDRLVAKMEENFQNWFKGMKPVFALMSNSV